MKQLFAIFLILFMLVVCGAATIVMLARGWFGVESSTTSVIGAPPTVAAVAPDATPTLAPLLPAPGTDGIAPAPGSDTAAGDFNGSFSGTLTTANGTSAPATLTLTQAGNDVAGRMEIGPGLTIDAGTCGSQAVPELVQSATGTIDPAAPNRLQSTGSIPAAGLTIGVILTADLAPDGQSVAARADLDLPFLCGQDPVISGTLSRN